MEGGRLTPGRPFPLKRQASVETGLTLSGSRFAGLRDGIQRPVLHVSQSSGTVLGDFLPPSPSTTTSPSTRLFGGNHLDHVDSPQTEASSANVSMHADLSSSSIAQSQASSLQTSSNSTASASTSISSATSVSTTYGPSVQPFNYSALTSADDVQAELAKVVEDLAIWLGVVESGLTSVLDAVGQASLFGKPAGYAEESEDADPIGVDDLYEYEGIDDE